MKIFLNDIRLRAYHGVLPQERQVGGEYLVSVSAETNHEKATMSDELADTVNYALVADVVRQEMAIPSQLLEHVCGRICRRMLRDFPMLDSVTVRLTKLVPPITGLQCNGSGVELTLSR